MAEKMNKLKIPETDSIEELAKFWDTHDLMDLEDQLEEVTEPIFERKIETFVVQLQPQDAQIVKQIAESEGMEYTALIREWVLEKIHAH